MYEAQCAVVGTVITNPIKRQTPSGEPVLSFRMASNARRQDRNTGEWTDGGTLFLTVTCWRRLVTGVGASLMKGDPVVAYGQLRTNEYTTREGVERADLEMTASAVGPDLARCVLDIDRRRSAPAKQTEPEDEIVGDQSDDYDEQQETDAEYEDTDAVVAAAV
ncbi:single-stranded DNA-binding protein [Rhodococcoides kyotonense]|uniref:Single-stranded DNA-binding protein n=1 Tax=Rhodococcoides kyotonense TaxID=398843 RepID=A0A239HCR5_9NOCA|nr:single-stranded DNA-binding protein [Rhodococcus kyotonensis]SNS79236.1 single-strand DNA-binding protein [Rhodococcus kyotonensis]